MTDESLSQKVIDGGRSVGYLALLIIISVSEIIIKTVLKIPGPFEDSDPPDSVAEIINIYQTSSEALIEEVKTKLTIRAFLMNLNYLERNGCGIRFLIC